MGREREREGAPFAGPASSPPSLSPISWSVGAGSDESTFALIARRTASTSAAPATSAVPPAPVGEPTERADPAKAVSSVSPVVVVQKEGCWDKVMG